MIGILQYFSEQIMFKNRQLIVQYFIHFHISMTWIISCYILHKGTWKKEGVI